MDEKQIKLYHTYSKIAPSIERFWRTLKNRLETYMTYTRKRRWLDVLQPMANTYNQTKHTVTKIAPNDVTTAMEDQILHQIYDKYVAKPVKQSIYKVGDTVKIARTKVMFEKSSTANFSSENFKVSEIVNTKPKTYKLVDLYNEPIAGKYCGEELAKVNLSNGP